MVEKFYLSIYIICTLMIGIATIITSETYGEAVNVNLDTRIIFLLLAAYIFTYLAFYCFYKQTKEHIPSIIGNIKLELHQGRIHIFFFIMLLLKIIGVLLFGIGRLYAEVTTNYSFVFTILKVEEFFPIYYVMARNKKKKMYWINILLFCIVRILQGWSAWVMTIAILELYFKIKEGNYIYKTFKMCNIQILAVFALLIGTIIYNYLRPLKYYIRYGGDISFYTTTIEDTFIALIARFSNFPVFTAAWQNTEIMVRLYQLENIFLSEFRSLFNPLLPSFITGPKDFRTMGNIVQWAQWDDFGLGSSTGYGFFMYWYTLFHCHIIDFIACTSAFIVLFFLTCSILRAFDNKNHDIKILYFMFLIKIAEGTQIQQLFSYGYIGSFYLMIIMWMLGVLKIKKIRCEFEKAGNI